MSSQNKAPYQNGIHLNVNEMCFLSADALNMQCTLYMDSDLKLCSDEKKSKPIFLVEDLLKQK